jgi:D-hexose-6-phosphate mutarotase
MNPMIELLDSRELYPRPGKGLPLLAISNGFAKAVLSLQGAQVLSYRPAGGGDLLWLSPKARLNPGLPIRGGIPLCSPWFAAGSGGRTPFHGFARTRPWSVLEARAEADGTTSVSLALEDGSWARELWEGAVSLRLDISVGSRLSMSFEARNEGSEALRLEHLWHSYFAVGDITRTKVSGLEGCEYIDKNEGRRRARQEGELLFDRPIDRIFPGAPKAQRIGLSDGEILVESDTACAVVWNAGERDAEVEDLGEGAHREYLCVERGDVDEGAVTVEGGGTYRAAMSIEKRLHASMADSRVASGS